LKVDGEEQSQAVIERKRWWEGRKEKDGRMMEVLEKVEGWLV
jgi:hypothetical protein